MGDWDPFADPADGDATASEAAAAAASAKLGTAKLPASARRLGHRGDPANPWEDEVYVNLSREAAEKSTVERYRAAEAEAERLRVEQADAERLVAERARRVAAREREAEAATLSPQERRAAERHARIQEQSYRQAMRAARAAPELAVARLADEVRDFYDREAHGDPAEQEQHDNGVGSFTIADEEVAFRERAARMMAGQMGIKINFRSMAPPQDRPVGLLFPDQGSRSLRLLSAARNLPGVSAMLSSLRTMIGFDPLSDVPLQGVWELFRGTEAVPVWLEETRICQPVMFVSAIAAVERLRQRRPGGLQRCQAVAGLALGELAALTVAGVLDFDLGLQLACSRGVLVQEAEEACPQRQLSVAGVPRETLETLCAEVAKDSNVVCQIAQQLFEEGFLCAGHELAIEALLLKVRVEKGCKQAKLLKASCGGAVHTPLMASARRKFLAELRGVEHRMHPPRCDVYFGVTGERVPAGAAPADVIPPLCEQLTSRILWDSAVRTMIEDGITEFYECGPMQQLKGMMKRIDQAAFDAMLCMDHVVKNEKQIPS